MQRSKSDVLNGFHENKKYGLDEREKIAEPFSIFKKHLFWWLYPLLRKGLEKPVEKDDLPFIQPEEDSKALGDLLQKNWDFELEKSKKSKSKPSFIRAIAKSFGKTYFLYGLIAFAEECIFKIIMPISIGLIIRYFNENSGVSDHTGFLFICALMLSYFGASMCHHPAFFGFQHIGMKIRIATSAIIYRKALKLSRRSMVNTPVGKMINLISNDVNKFDIGLIMLNYIWIGPIQSIITTVLLWNEIGPSCLAGMAIFILYVPFQSFMGRKYTKLRLKIAEKTDDRIGIMDEIIGSMRVVKQYAWEDSFKKVVQLARKLEIKAITDSNNLRCLNLAIFNTAAKVAVFVIIIAYGLSGNAINAEKVFVTISLINNIQLTMTLFFYFAISQGAESAISCFRIQNFLLLEEKESGELVTKSNLRPKPQDCSIRMLNVNAKWDHTCPDYTLKNISFTAKAGQMVALIGTVGAGKSSLIQAALGELACADGEIEVRGKLSYAAQESWIFSGSIRSNILFGQPYYADKYSKVVKVCSLLKDFDLFPEGDLTQVGEKGAALSGGQKARINLARCVYFDADIYLLDDPLSAVDATVGKHLFQQCIKTYLGDKIVILATHQQQFIKTASQVIVMKNGYVEAQGTYSQVKAQGIDFSAMDEHDQEENQEGDFLNVPSSHNVARLRRPSECRSIRNDSIRHGSMYRSSIHSCSISRFSVAESDTQSMYGHTGAEGSMVSIQHDDAYGEIYHEKEIDNETKKVGDIGLKLYLKYFMGGGGICWCLALILSGLAAQVTFVGSDYWLSVWTNKEQALAEGKLNISSDADVSIDFDDTQYYLYIYTAITVILVVTSLLRALLLFKICMKSSTVLHNKMFSAIISVPLSFFETRPVGQILNRFTKDTGQVDDILPPALYDFLTIYINVLSIFLMVIFVNVWIIIPIVVLLVVFSFIRWIYMHTAIDVKRLEGITRSPVFSHLSSSFEGLSTIRAFGGEQTASEQFDAHQNVHTSAWSTYLASTRLFGIYLDTLANIFITCVIFGFWFQKDVLGGNVGLALTLSMRLCGMLQWGVRQSAEVENHMVSVERILEYSKLEPEIDEAKENVEPNWPQNGKIEFKHVTLSYKADDPPVLKDLNFVVYPAQKIGIVGRTGAGKSSLLSCLFRLAPFDGNIFIDGKNTRTIHLTELRSSLSIIPQDPTLFSGTLRYNMDPFEHYSDDQIWSALEQAQLKEFVRLNLEAGLNSLICEGGGNVSVGQRQLICLARAILKHNKILVMDEATANVDPKTDNLIQETIRKNFKNCTVLTIAHRLNTIIDADKIMVMDAGVLKEFDSAHELLKDPKSIFSSLINETGTSNHLKTVAEEAHNRNLQTELSDQSKNDVLSSYTNTNLCKVGNSVANSKIRTSKNSGNSFRINEVQHKNASTETKQISANNETQPYTLSNNEVQIDLANKYANLNTNHSPHTNTDKSVQTAQNENILSYNEYGFKNTKVTKTNSNKNLSVFKIPPTIIVTNHDKFVFDNKAFSCDNLENIEEHTKL